MRDRLQDLLDQIAELALELGAEPDESGDLDVDALANSDDPSLAALGAAGSALLGLHDSLPDDEEPSEAEQESPTEDMSPEE